MVKSYLEEFHIQVLPHPPYSPDLSPCDFWFNPYIKSCLRGRKFETRSAVSSALYQCINRIQKFFFRMDFPSRKMCPGQWRVLWRSRLVITAKVSHIFIARSCCHNLKNDPRKNHNYKQQCSSIYYHTRLNILSFSHNHIPSQWRVQKGNNQSVFITFSCSSCAAASTVLQLATTFCFLSIDQ